MSAKAKLAAHRNYAAHAQSPMCEEGGGGFIARWRDRPKRTKERARAQAELDAIRADAVAALAIRSRSEARERGAKRFIGLPCTRHNSAERYSVSGNCCHCVSERTAARRGMPKVFGMLRRHHYYRPHLKHVPKQRHGAPFPMLDREV
jgi:hypothetical protein